MNQKLTPPLQEFFETDFSNPKVDEAKIEELMHLHLKQMGYKDRTVILVDACPYEFAANGMPQHTFENVDIHYRSNALRFLYYGRKNNYSAYSAFNQLQNKFCQYYLIPEINEYICAMASPFYDLINVLSLANFCEEHITFIDLYKNGLYYYLVYESVVVCRKISPLITKNGKLHSIDRPAIKWIDIDYYALAGVLFTEEQKQNCRPMGYASWQIKHPEDQLCAIAFLGLDYFLKINGFLENLDLRTCVFVKNCFDEISLNCTIGQKNRVKNYIAANLIGQ